jgi:hypothetical protein
VHQHILLNLHGVGGLVPILSLGRILAVLHPDAANLISCLGPILHGKLCGPLRAREPISVDEIHNVDTSSRRYTHEQPQHAVPFRSPVMLTPLSNGVPGTGRRCLLGHALPGASANAYAKSRSASHVSHISWR